MKLIEIIKKIEEKMSEKINWNTTQLLKNEIVDCGCADCDNDENDSNSECYNIDHWFYKNELSKAISFYGKAIDYINDDLIIDLNELNDKFGDDINFELTFSYMSDSIYLEIKDENDDDQTIRISDHSRKSFESNCVWSDHTYFLQKIIK